MFGNANVSLANKKSGTATGPSRPSSGPPRGMLAQAAVARTAALRRAARREYTMKFNALP